MCLLAVFSFSAYAQETTPNVPQGTASAGIFYKSHVSPSIQSRGQAPEMDLTPQEAKDKRSLGNTVVIGKDRQTQNDYFVRNRNEAEQSVRVAPPTLVFDAYQASGQPTDPAMAVGPNNVFVVFNTGFVIYDKAGNDVGGGQRPVTDIFSGGGCCDLTASYDQAANRWVITYLWASNGQIQVAVSDGPNPVTTTWSVYTIPNVQDYNKLSVWSDGYYITANTSGGKVWALDRAEMIAGNASATYQTFNLPGIVTSGFYSPQALNVSDDNMPAAGGATFLYLQDNAWTGVTTDHVKLWTVDVDWATPANSTISAATELPATPFISVFDGGSFSNLTQPDGGVAIDALQATIMNQAQFRKFATHNSALFNFVIDTDASPSIELAGVRWFELRQAGDNQPWTVYQEGTYTAPDGRHAWHASMVMDGVGNIAMGYTSMAGPTTPNPTNFRVSSYYTGRFSGDPLNAMTVVEEIIAAGNANIPTLRYGDYSKIDIDPSDDATFWFINEYMKSGRKGVVGAFTLTPPGLDDIGITLITSPNTGVLTATEVVTVDIRNFGSNDITNPEVQYILDGNAAVVDSYSGTISAGATESFTFSTTGDFSATGSHTIVAKTNFAGDTNTGNDEITKIVFNGLVYCEPTGNCDPLNDGVTKLALVDQDLDVNCGTTGYSDDTSIVFNFNLNNNPFNGTVQMGYVDSAFAIWIDFNDNGIFESDELIANEDVAAANTDFNFTIDFNAITTVTSGSHRMRVRGEDVDQSGDYLDPCGDLSFGRTNDYTANISGALGIEDVTITNGELIVLTQANNQFDISLITTFDGTASIAIYNVLGQTLAFNNLEKEGDRFNYQLDMSFADTGVYFIKVGNTNSGTFKTAKIIVK